MTFKLVIIYTLAMSIAPMQLTARYWQYERKLRKS